MECIVNKSDVVEEKIFAMDRAALDAYPDGVITLAPDGSIVRYNKTEASLARRSAEETIGRNFFTDVAPCTAVKDFQGRFDAFVANKFAAVDRFDFVFRFAWGRQDVSITMLRKPESDEVTLIVARRSEAKA
jgi:photoactive yellow protein